MSKSKLIAGITGQSSSGKTFFINRIKQELGNQVSVISLDNYYKPIELQQKDANGEVNFDLPEGIFHEEFLGDLQQLISGKSISRKKYTFNNPEDKESEILVEPAPIIIAEGIFLFHYPQIFEQIDFKVFIKANPSITLERRLIRDLIERGYSAEKVTYQWENHVLPSHQQFVLPYLEYSDLIIENSGTAEENVEILKNNLLKRANLV